jgi:NADH-quinone oxidoreductase subunit H
MVGCVLFSCLVERKLLAFFTVRKGPNRVGPWGLFQTIADAIKLLFKEDIISSGQARFYLVLRRLFSFSQLCCVWLDSV